MDKLYTLKDRLMKELEGYAGKELTASSLDIIMKMAGAVKNIAKIIMCEEDERGGYSSRMYYGRDPMGRDVEPGRDYSYRRRDSRGRYSGDMGYSRHGDVSEQLRDLIDQAPDDQTRRELERIARKMELA